MSLDEPQHAPAAAEAEAEARLSVDEVLDGWDQLRRRLAACLAAPDVDATWIEQFRKLGARLRELARREPDGALYLLMHAAGSETDHYSAQHAMACAVIAELAARWLGHGTPAVDSLVLAALSMNNSMTAMQDALARQAAPPSALEREAIDGHAAESANRLAAAGIDDPVWLHIVRHHHEIGPDLAAAPTDDPRPALTELLRRIDIYTAKLSRRAGRAAISPAIAARDACLGPAGHPDPIGATLLRVLGLYPPGTFVQLANGELGVVVKRGEKAHTPWVASLRRSDGGLLMQPVRRNTAVRAYAVQRGVRPSELRVRLSHQRVLGC